ncbi:MAG: DUF805 domain-containing protein [Parvibaculaceae bacterium]|nr:DUF805 domain-containing protein [Parvibaculaceae bacterium]
MTFGQALHSTFRENYATFSGRAPRSEYWFVTLFWILVTIGIVAVGAALYTILEPVLPEEPGAIGGLLLIGIGLIVFVGVAIPMFALVVRRFHDVGLSGWWYFAPILVANVLAVMQPAIGNGLSSIVSIAVFVVTVWGSNAGPNKYGENPHAQTDVTTFE